MWVMVALKSIGRQCGRELQGVQDAAHAPAEGIVDHLVLLDAVFALERRRNDVRRPVVVVAGEVFELDPGIGKFRFDQALDLGGWHGHSA